MLVAVYHRPDASSAGIIRVPLAQRAFINFHPQYSIFRCGRAKNERGSYNAERPPSRRWSRRLDRTIDGGALAAWLMPEHLPMEISVNEADGIHLLKVRGRLTIGEPSDQLNAALQSVVQGGGRKVVIDLNGVPQIDSSGISSLVRISIQLAREGGAVHLVCGAGRVRDALTVTRLIEAIPTFDSDSKALASFT